jgi:DNA-binding MarR family transcriptional regulator
MSGRGVKTAFQGRAKQILIRIADNSGEIHTNQLVDALGIKRPNIGQYVSLLRKEGFITSEKSGNDKRFVYHS